MRINCRKVKVPRYKMEMGVSGLWMHEDGRVIGYGWTNDADYIDALNTERYRYKELMRDKAEAYYTSVLREFAPIPEFKGENDVEKGILWNRIAAAGCKIRWFNKKIYACEYLADGMSKNIIKNYLKNYNGYTLYEREHIHLAIGWKEKARSTLRYYEISKMKGVSDAQIALKLKISKSMIVVIKGMSFIKKPVLRFYRIFRKPQNL